jgi:hypothetical protein
MLAALRTAGNVSLVQGDRSKPVNSHVEDDVQERRKTNITFMATCNPWSLRMRGANSDAR